MKRLLTLTITALMFGCGEPNISTSTAPPIAGLLSFTLPPGSEVYLDANSIYAEIDGVDVTTAIFEKELADKAITQFHEAHAKQASQNPLAVTNIAKRTISGLSAVVVDYKKPAKLLTRNKNGEFSTTEAVEYTRQIYFDFGKQSFVLTAWAKKTNSNAEAVAEEILASVSRGDLAQKASLPLEITTSGLPLDVFSGVSQGGVLGNHLQFDLGQKQAD